MLGEYRSLWEAQSCREVLRARGGGGIVTALLVHALEQGSIEEALVVTASEQEPWAQPVIVGTAEQLVAAAGSKYLFVPYGKLVNQLGPRSALVGLPCQTKAYRERPFLKIGLFCGLNLAPRGRDYLLRQLEVDKEQIDSLDYRAPGGGLLIQLKDGRQVRYGTYAWLAYFFSYKRCLKCLDQTNHYADISVGDRRPGWSSVLVRSARGEALFRSALEAGCIRAKQLDKSTFIGSLTSPFLQKELRGGYINTRLVRVRGRWIEMLPLSLLKRLGRLVYRYTRRQGRSSCATPSSGQR